VRDLASYQADRLRRSSLNVVWGDDLACGLGSVLGDALESLEECDSIYLHVDLDVLDPSEGRANRYASPDGLRFAEIDLALEAIFSRFEVAAAAVTAYDPSLDDDGRMGNTAVRAVEAITRRCRHSSDRPA
jgi:arginase